MIAVDASVVTKWYVPEANTNEAQELFDSGEPLRAPDLIRVEVAAAITRKFRKGEIAKEAVACCLKEWKQHLERRIIVTMPAEYLLERAAAFSIQLKHPLQDCLYLATAEWLCCPLVTADRKFHERAQGSGVKVLLLGA